MKLHGIPLVRQALIWLAILAASWLALRWFERRQVYFPTRGFSTHGSDLGRPWEEMSVTTSDGYGLHGWFFPVRKAPGAVLICHGNAGNVSHRLDLCALVLQQGWSVLVFDYRGYGRSQGRPSEEGTYRDAQAACQWLRHKGCERIVVLGESLGGAVAVELALRERVEGLVLQSTFTSIPDVGSELFPFLPVRWLASIRYDTQSKLPRVKTPILFLHSRQDSLIRFHHAEANFQAAHPPKWLREINGDHNDALLDGGTAYARHLGEFLNQLKQP